MDNVIRGIYVNDLSGGDVQLLTRGKAVVRLYEDLLKFNNIIDALGPNGQMVLLFPVLSNSSGHWIGTLYYPNTKTIEHFDPYGFTISQEAGYTDNTFVKRNLLGDLYDKAQAQGYKIFFNPYKFQVLAKGINTCGRHTSMRCRFHYLTCDEYAKLMLNQKMSADWLVTCLSFIALTDDVSDEEGIVKELGKIKNS